MERIDHIAIIVEDMDRALLTYETLTGKRAEIQDENLEMGVRSSFIRFGELVIELIVPLGPGPLAREAEAKGPGLHHIAYRVRDLPGLLERLRKNGVRVLDDLEQKEGEPLGVFLDPEYTGGVLTELIQKS